MTIKEICNQIINSYEGRPEASQNKYPSFQLVYQLRTQINKKEFTVEDLVIILETTKQIASTKKKMKQILEKNLLDSISYLPHLLWEENNDEKKPHFQRNTESKEAKIADLMINFAKDIYEIKIDRDAFSGKRRGYAVRILENIANYFDTPEFMELCTKSLKNKSKNEFIDSTESLKDYCVKNDQIPSDELIAIVDKRIEKTKHKVEIMSGLVLQIDTGIISEFEALSRLDEWKTRNE